MTNRKIISMHNSLLNNKLDENKELLIVSFFATNKSALLKLEAQWRERDPAHQKYLGRISSQTMAVTSRELGGEVCLMDPSCPEKGFIAKASCPVATGLYYHPIKKSLYVGSNKWIRVIKRGRQIRTIGNTLFNDIHTLNKTPQNNLLVASTGVDGILEVSFETGFLYWDWLATEHGYDKTPEGKKRIINRNVNYQKIGTNTTQHTTHINSALYYKKNKILATLFHQGKLIEINTLTKKSRVILDNLKSPHHIRERKDGFIISDTRNNRVLLLNQNFKIENIFEDDYNWIQDCIQLSTGEFIIGDSNNNRLVKVNHFGKKTNEFRFKDARKMSSFLLIKAQDALEIFYE